MATRMTVRQFAAEMDVHPNTVYRWIIAGILPCQKARNIIRIRDRDIAEFERRSTFDARPANENDKDDEGEPAPRKPSRSPFGKGIDA